jgi:hypothetical protein
MRRSDEGDDEPADRVADALLGESTYERLRFRRQGFFRQPIPVKLRIQSSLLFGLAAVLPLMAAFPASVRETLDGSVVQASPKVIVLGLIGGVVVFLGGIALAGVALARLRLGDRMTEYRAETLLSVEEVSSLLGIGTGGIAILLTLGYVVLGHGGQRAIETYIRTMGRSPFAASGVDVSVATVATSAFVGAVALFVLAQGLHLELTLRLDDYGYTEAGRAGP